MSLWVVVGGQFGSEGKGKISAFIVHEESIDLCIRCGGPNSGHSFLDEFGQLIMLKQLPTGAYHGHPRLLIPAGALIDPLIIQHEIERFSLGPDRVGIDLNTMVIAPDDKLVEERLGLHTRLSSTLTGVGSAISRRVMRSADVTLAKNAVKEHPWLRPYLTRVAEEANAAIVKGCKVLVEGTQGFGLSLYHSPFYPKTTSRDTSAAGFISEVGLSPRLVTEIVMVLRTFPIRVAGEQAGPLAGEISWGDVEREARSPISLSEYTSVTQKLRRVGRFDFELVRHAATVNQPTRIALNFLDHLDFDNRYCKQWKYLNPSTQEFVENLESKLNIPIAYCGTGPHWNDFIVRSQLPELRREHTGVTQR